MRALPATVAMVAVAALTGCGASRGGPEPVVSPTGKVYEIGTPPRETRRSQTATLYLRQDRPERALDLALEGLGADPENPIHYFLAGVAHARMGDLIEADRRFTEAAHLYPAYELDIEPEREAAWGTAFNAGLEAYERGDVERTIQIWTEAVALYDLRPEAHRNLASVLSVEGRYDEAIDAYRTALAGLDKRPATRKLQAEELENRRETARGLEEELVRLLLVTERYAEAEPLLRTQLDRDPSSAQVRSDLASALAGQGKDTEARAIYATLLSEEGLAATQLFNLGVGLFRSSDFHRAAAAFRRLTKLRPTSRDAWFNYANSLFAAEDWKALAPVGTRLVELDPLGESVRLITARAQLEVGDEVAARRSLELADAAPVHLDDLRLRRSSTQTTVEGRVTGNAAAEGTRVRLRFVFVGDAGEDLGSTTIEVTAPAPGENTRLDVAFAARASAYRYELIQH